MPPPQTSEKRPDTPTRNVPRKELQRNMVVIR